MKQTKKCTTSDIETPRLMMQESLTNKHNSELWSAQIENTNTRLATLLPEITNEKETPFILTAGH